jgi:hypothetical protein
LPSHQLEPLTERVKTLFKHTLFQIPFHKDQVKLMKLELLAWKVLRLSETLIPSLPLTDHTLTLKPR